MQELAGYVEELALQVFEEEVNLYTICKALVKPLTLRFRCSFVELVAAGPQEPLWFVSHWWGTPFRQTASLIAFHALERELSPAAAYWICAPSLESSEILRARDGPVNHAKPSQDASQIAGLPT